MWFTAFCQTLCEKQFKKNILYGLSPLTVHNIVIRSHDSWKIRVTSRPRVETTVECTFEHSSGISWETIILSWWIGSLLLHTEMQPETLLCKKKAILLWAPAKVNQKTVERCSVVRQVHISACFRDKLRSDYLKKTIETVISAASESEYLQWYGGASVLKRIKQWRTQNVEQLKSCIQQEWAPAKLQPMYM